MSSYWPAGAGSRLVLRGAFRGHVVRHEAVLRQDAREHDLRVVFERIRHDPVVERAQRLAVSLDVEPIFQRVPFLPDGARHYVAMDLQLLAAPVALAAHDLVHVLVRYCMLSPSVVYSRIPKTVASTSVVTPIFAALWLIDKDFR